MNMARPAESPVFPPRSGRWLRYVAPVVVTVAALAAALTQIDIGSALAAARDLKTADLVFVFAALGAGALLASARLQLIAHDLGYPMRLRDALAALSLGQIAGSLFFQIVGQTAARTAFLSRRGMPLSGTLVITGYERLAALLVSVLIATGGAWFLFGRITVDLEHGGAAFVKLAVGLVLAVIAGAAFAWGKGVSQSLRRVAGPQAAGRIIRVIMLSVLIQLSTMAAYIVAARALAPMVDIGALAAAAAVVMLAAALPISLAGWGIRELSAIYALGIIGLPKEKALIVAVVVGCAALLVVGVLALVALLVPRSGPPPVKAAAGERIDYAALLAWSVPVAAATAVFFQIHIPLARAPLNVNLADPVALVGALLFAAGAVRAGRLPSWRLPALNLHLALMTAVLAAAFLYGWSAHGWSGWAFTNRLVGWFVLLAYLATGALVVRVAGAIGFSVLTSTFVAVALAIVLIDAVIFAVIAANFQVPMEIVRYRIEGFTQNANAFALQLLLAIAALLSWPATRPRGQVLALTLALLGLWLTGSKAGLLALGAVLLVGVALGAARIPRLVAAGVASAALVLIINWLPDLIFALAQTGKIVAHAARELFCSGCEPAPEAGALVKRDFSALGVVASGYESSRTERAASLQAAWQMFLQHPVFGSGLGAFLEQHARQTGAPLVIHSTPLWLLAETGIVGLLVFAAPILRILTQAIGPARREDAAARFLVLGSVGFCVMASVHEMLYQRPLWLLLGAALAMPRPAETR